MHSINRPSVHLAAVTQSMLFCEHKSKDPCLVNGKSLNCDGFERFAVYFQLPHPKNEEGGLGGYTPRTLGVQLIKWSVF